MHPEATAFDEMSISFSKMQSNSIKLNNRYAKIMAMLLPGIWLQNNSYAIEARCIVAMHFLHISTVSMKTKFPQPFALPRIAGSTPDRI